MGNAITLDMRALWLMLRNDSGHWTVSELTHFWRPTFDREEVQRILDAMAGMGFVKRSAQVASTKYAYCVTADCIPMPGLSTQPGSRT